MEEKKFCKFCGEKINKDSIVCPKCGRQLEDVSKEKPNNSDDNVGVEKPSFYKQLWFMWVMLVIFAPIGIFFMWKFHPEMKKNTKIILTVVFALLFIIFISTSGDETDDNLDHPVNKSVEVTVVDFSSMERANVEVWCSDNKINCSIVEQYSDTISKGTFVKQSVAANSVVYEGQKITITYSLGKKPSIEYENALKKAELYSSTLHMSKRGIYDQLTSEYGENFPADAAQYAIDNMKADWNANALAKAKTYQSTLNMSKNAIYDQLISEYGEKFTKEEAQYAIDHLED